MSDDPEDVELEDADDEVADEPCEMLGFYGEDHHFLQELKVLVRLLISRKTTTPEQIFHLAKLLLALTRFPRPTPGMALELELGMFHANGERSYQDLYVDGTSFRVGKGAYIIVDPAMGGDGTHDTFLEVEVSGYRDLAYPTALADWVEEFRTSVKDPEQRLRISDAEDEGKIDWDAEHHDSDWENTDSDYA